MLKGESRVILKKAKEDIQAETPIILTAAALNRTSQTVAGTKQRKSDVLNGRGLELFEQLRELRTVMAKAENVPPYLIFSDKTLVDMCIKIPFTEEEMMGVSGVGENKCSKYGRQFAKEITDFVGGKKEKLYFGEREEVLTGREGTSRGKSRERQAYKQDFFLTAEQAVEFPYEEKYLVTEIAEHMNKLRNPDTTKKISGAVIFRYIMEEGFASQTFLEEFPEKRLPKKEHKQDFL